MQKANLEYEVQFGTKIEEQKIIVRKQIKLVLWITGENPVQPLIYPIGQYRHYLWL